MLSKLELRVFGPEPPCSRCRSALEVAEKVASRHPDVEVLHVNALSEEAQRYGFWMTPAIALGDELAFEGKVPTERELEKAVVDVLDQS
jgi:hypothetical protein